VGFPGETEADFEATRALLASMPVTYLHVFPFSPRPGTAAAALRDDVPHAEKARRGAVLRAMSTLARERRAAALAGRTVEVVDVQAAKDGRGTEALAADYTRVVRPGPARSGRYRVLVTAAHGATATGNLAAPQEN
jgi:threonylcarbamoyladenosine tRNA methylthiotransferase MtaB